MQLLTPVVVAEGRQVCIEIRPQVFRPFVLVFADVGDFAYQRRICEIRRAGQGVSQPAVLIRRIVERGQRRQQLPSSLHPGLVADAVVGALVYRLLVSGDGVTRQTAARVVDLVVRPDRRT